MQRMAAVGTRRYTINTRGKGELSAPGMGARDGPGMPASRGDTTTPPRSRGDTRACERAGEVCAGRAARGSTRTRAGVEAPFASMPAAKARAVEAPGVCADDGARPSLAAPPRLRAPPSPCLSTLRTRALPTSPPASAASAAWPVRPSAVEWPVGAVGCNSAQTEEGMHHGRERERNCRVALT